MEARCVLVGLVLLSSACQCVAQPNPEVGTNRSTIEAWRLLFNSTLTDQGLRVRFIDHDSPTRDMVSLEETNLHGILEVDDIIHKINGKQIRTFNDYFKEMDQLPASGEVELTVIDAWRRRPHRWKMLARRVSVPAAVPDSDGPGNASAPTNLRKAHFLLIGLTNDSQIGGPMEESIAMWRELQAFIPEDRRGVLREIVGNECTAEGILNAIQSLPVAHRDTLFCCFCGHGANDPSQAPLDDPARGHYFALPSGDLMRYQLLAALRAKDPRLCVLITDSCNKPMKALPAIPMNAETRTMTVRGKSPFEELLLDYQGVVDINGADFGQYAFCRPGYGAYFTRSSAPVLRSHSDWRAAFEQAKLVTERDFQAQKQRDGQWSHEGQPHLTPVAFRLNVWRNQTYTMAPPTEREIAYTVTVPAAP